ncbi:MAG: SufD family Fe-S cluster assembly protein [Candidatus Moranbacteria bacterium]|nr:SufD family Fe-S cluster assembly protein [Candidatus Moranbacteria bacterium]
MQYKDISQDATPLYRLKTNEKRVFFMLNRTGVITIELAGHGAEAHIFSFFIGRNTDKATLKIFQKHLAPKTTSHALIKSVLSDESEVAYEGSIFMNKQAIQGDASQESRAILLSPNTKVSLKPTLEILANDVRCRHAATAGPISQESLFFAESRGLSKTQATKLLIDGFFNDALQKMEKLGVDIVEIKKILGIRY